MLLQTNSYIVPKEKRTEHARLLQRFKQLLAKHGCDHFEAYEQVGANWSGAEPTGRFVQIMRFRDRQHWLSVQSEEKNDPQAKQLIQEFCELINLPYQMQAGLFAAVYFNGVITQHHPRPGAPAIAEGASEPVAHVDVAEENSGAATKQEVFDPDPVDEPATEDTLESTDDPPMQVESAGDEPRLVDEQESPADRNGESDVMDFLEEEPANPAPQDQRQRID